MLITKQNMSHNYSNSTYYPDYDFVNVMITGIYGVSLHNTYYLTMFRYPHFHKLIPPGVGGAGLSFGTPAITSLSTNHTKDFQPFG